MERTSGPAHSPLSGLTAVTDLFASPLRTSHYLELVNPLWTTHKLQARVVGVWDETASTRTLTLRPGRGWRRHRAGQHVRVGVAIGGMHHTRTYSISPAPERPDGCITITPKAAPAGRVPQHPERRIVPGDHLPTGLPPGDVTSPPGGSPASAPTGVSGMPTPAARRACSPRWRRTGGARESPDACTSSAFTRRGRRSRPTSLAGTSGSPGAASR